jgi:hypothetical protein
LLISTVYKITEFTPLDKPPVSQNRRELDDRSGEEQGHLIVSASGSGDVRALCKPGNEQFLQVQPRVVPLAGVTESLWQIVDILPVAQQKKQRRVVPPYRRRGWPGHGGISNG